MEGEIPGICLEFAQVKNLEESQKSDRTQIKGNTSNAHHPPFPTVNLLESTYLLQYTIFFLDCETNKNKENWAKGTSKETTDDQIEAGK